MTDFLSRAQALKEELVRNRRTIHQFGGVGLDLPETTAYVMEQLRQMGLEPVEICKSGVVCCVGGKRPGKTILLRADMDALPIEEKTGLPFACTNGTMHACGHDMHPAMLLGAARLLKEREEELQGTVKLMFQPGEEVLEGAKAMVKAGLLENPKVGAAVAMHVGIGRKDCRSGYVTYVSGPSGSSADELWVTLTRDEGSGANLVDAACHMILGLKDLPSLEIRINETFGLMINAFVCDNDDPAGLPESVTFKGVMICMNDPVRNQARDRIVTIIEELAKAHRVRAKIHYERSVAPLVTSKELGDQINPAIAEVVGDGNVEEQPLGFLSFGAEDFAEVAKHVKAVYLNLGAGCPDEGYTVEGHKDNVVFNEDVLPLGAAIYANVAYRWLQGQA